MADIGQKLETKGVIMTLLSLVLISTGCEDKIDSPAVNPSVGETVEVTLNIGLADEVDGYTLSAPSTTKSNVAAFSYALQPAMATKGAESSLKPDKLYKLEIQQYDQNGNHIGGMNTSDVTDHEIGSTFNQTLTANSDCQLVIVAWGDGNSTTLGTDKLASAQEKSVDASAISKLNPSTQSDMNKMPYILHLEHVCVESNTIKSIEGENKDVRLLLRRLASRLTLDWTYSYSGYQLKQILLQSIPTNYKVVAAPDKTDKTYPSLLDQFTTIQLTADEIDTRRYSCWVPANVRGSNSAATSQRYRIKSNAPTGSSYVDFIAANTIEPKKKLSYRVYLGGSESSDFNLYGNTDYNYKVTIDHADYPVNDRRVTIIDPIPASENNSNFVPTANCFMVAPGGAFCFNPYKYNVGGMAKNNTTLAGSDWCNINGSSIGTPIKYVKVLWQTKEYGDIGDPILGVVNSSTDHANIVDMTNGESVENARIYCRIAPNTIGGSGAIAAYNESDEILWSWHIWVTDYNPDATGNQDIQTPVHKRKLKFEYGSYIGNLPMMDRNLGAAAGYITLPPDELEKSKTNGFYYQWGRKDPFRGSYSNINISQVLNTEIKANAPTKGLLSLFGADGLTFYPMSVIQRRVSFREAYKDPGNMYKIPTGASQWIDSATEEYKNAWGAGNSKGLHDPCPAGWRIANTANYRQLFNSNGTGVLRIKEKGSGGYVIYYDRDGVNTTYFYLAGYWSQNGLTGINGNMYMWCGDALSGTSGRGGFHLIMGGDNTGKFLNNGNERESLLVRCIQERE
ncbi:DUF4906 domain-containing protein [Parabacteroides sp. BX2]|jgi:hypothetical protein|uniref:DUF4906 domain-containing protein n=2 Tax=Parabacteroides TaxID=375288 RepID=A0ABR7E4C9_9BACT|nr:MULTISPECIES: DUF4906 domain-containing protein [Parabacteroides]MBC5644636.1 DUF4906 domain-containing protein [Parabacteroides segnis]MCM0714119.1 fibrobacter succinogenes major paralogous domain-containing protein [Parabacteroides sp. TA-V-105]